MSFDLDTVFVAAFVFLLVYAAITDVKGMRIANWISLALIGEFALYLALGAKPLPVAQHVAVALALLAAGFVAFALGYMGAGDVKLLAAAALWAGPSKVLELLIVTCLTGGALGLIVRAGREYLMWDASGWSPVRISRAVPAWIRRGLVPYGVAISAGGILSVPALLL